MVIQLAGAAAFVLGLLLLPLNKDVAKKVIMAGLAVVAFGFLISQLVPLVWLRVLVGVAIVVGALAFFRRPVVRAGGALLGVVTVLSALAIQTPADTTLVPTADGGACPDVVLVGLRGSGEPRTDHGGYGKTVGAVRDRLKADVEAAGQAFADEPIPYPAVGVGKLVDALTRVERRTGVWWGSVDDGASRTAQAIRDIAAGTCEKRSKVAVVGYSQGAWAAHLGLRQLTAEERKVVVSVDLIADPLRIPSDANPLSAPETFGIGNIIEDAGGWRDPASWRSWCAAGDVVCDSLAAVPANAMQANDAITRFNQGGDVHATSYRTNEMAQIIAWHAEEDLGMTTPSDPVGQSNGETE